MVKLQDDYRMKFAFASRLAPTRTYLSLIAGRDKQCAIMQLPGTDKCASKCAQIHLARAKVHTHSWRNNELGKIIIMGATTAHWHCSVKTKQIAHASH